MHHIPQHKLNTASHPFLFLFQLLVLVLNPQTVKVVRVSVEGESLLLVISVRGEEVEGGRKGTQIIGLLHGRW